MLYKLEKISTLQIVKMKVIHIVNGENFMLHIKVLKGIQIGNLFRQSEYFKSGHLEKPLNF